MFYLNQIWNDEKSSSVETVGTMNANKMKWLLSNEVINDIDECLNNFRWWALAMTFTSKLQIRAFVIFYDIFIVITISFCKIDPKPNLMVMFMYILIKVVLTFFFRPFIRSNTIRGGNRYSSGTCESYWAFSGTLNGKNFSWQSSPFRGHLSQRGGGPLPFDISK